MENWGGLRSISILFKSVLQTENVLKGKRQNFAHGGFF